MKSYNKIFIGVIAFIVIAFIAANTIMLNMGQSESGRTYRVEISRLALEIEENGFGSIDLSQCSYVTDIEKYGDDFYNAESDYVVREIGGELYRFDYTANEKNNDIFLIVNIFLTVMAVMNIAVMIYIRSKIILPFDKLKEIPYELSKGNLTPPIKENKSRFFGRFIWGVDLLRENMEEQKKRELDLQKEKKTLLLSLSHDIKTPLSAIKLYSKALSKGLYADKEKQAEIADNIGVKADEIENFVSQIINASRGDFLSLDVNNGEFYLSELVKKITDYYSERLALIKTYFKVENHTNCLLKGDIYRSVEVFQNIIENAVKYGDGKEIRIEFSEEENCLLISVQNSGCTLSEAELPHIFESFWRGSNSDKTGGSGLGLYICRQLMHKMGGDIFAEINNSYIFVTAVFQKA